LHKADFSAQNAPKSFVAGLHPDSLEELTVLPQTPLAAFDSPTSKRGRRFGEKRGGEMLRTPYGKFLATPLLT